MNSLINIIYVDSSGLPHEKYIFIMNPARFQFALSFPIIPTKRVLAENQSICFAFNYIPIYIYTNTKNPFTCC